MLDELLIFSKNQAITGTTTSTNILDLGKKREVAFGTPVNLDILITEDFNNCTSINFEVLTSEVEAMTSPIALASSTVVLANLQKGKRVPIAFMPSGNKGFVQLKYTVTGSAPSTGKVSAYLSDGTQQSFNDK